MKFFQIAIGALIVGLGLMMLFVLIRDGANDGGAGQAIMAPLSLIGVGAFAISAASKRKKK